MNITSICPQTVEFSFETRGRDALQKQQQCCSQHINNVVLSISNLRRLYLCQTCNHGHIIATIFSLSVLFLLFFLSFFFLSLKAQSIFCFFFTLIIFCRSEVNGLKCFVFYLPLMDFRHDHDNLYVKNILA